MLNIFFVWKSCNISKFGSFFYYLLNKFLHQPEIRYFGLKFDHNQNSNYTPNITWWLKIVLFLLADFSEISFFRKIWIFFLKKSEKSSSTRFIVAVLKQFYTQKVQKFCKICYFWPFPHNYGHNFGIWHWQKPVKSHKTCVNWHLKLDRDFCLIISTLLCNR